MDFSIARHYRDRNHGFAASLKFVGIERVLPNPRGENLVQKLLQTEAYWIFALNSIEPHGLSEIVDFSSFLT